MTTYVTVNNKLLSNDDVKKYDRGLEPPDHDRIYLPFASYRRDILARAYTGEFQVYVEKVFDHYRAQPKETLESAN